MYALGIIHSPNMSLLFYQHCAQTLLDFNGGTSCVQVYVNQHDFFISKNRVVDSNTVESNQLCVYFTRTATAVAEQYSRWETLPDPDVSPPKAEPGLTALFDDIRETMKMESQIVQVVFPNPPAVMQVFLQRVFGPPVWFIDSTGRPGTEYVPSRSNNTSSNS